MASPLRPQSLLLNVLGLYVRNRPVAVSTGSLIEVLGRVGVGEDAARSTVARMVKRGLLARHPRGRQVYVGLTRRSTEVLEDGHRRIWETGAVNSSWDGTWTMVAFSLPDDRRSDRHGLRSRLQWAGFGPVQGGLWVAAGRRDVASAVAPLGLEAHVVAFTGEVLAPTEEGEIVQRAFDTDTIARGYATFLDRWAPPAPAGSTLPDDLARQLVLHTDWLAAVGQDPYLPGRLLPPAWPAIEAERLFRRLAGKWEEPAAAEATEVLDLLDL